MTTPYTGNAATPPQDRTTSDPGQVFLGTDTPNAGTFNGTLQWIMDRLAWLRAKAGLLNVASSWTAKQTFQDVDMAAGYTRNFYGAENIKSTATVTQESGSTRNVSGAEAYNSGATMNLKAGSTLTLDGNITKTGSTIGQVIGCQASGVLTCASVVREAISYVGVTTGAATWLNGFGNYSGQQTIYMRSSSGIVYIQACLINSGTYGQPAFNLPSGYRPNGTVEIVSRAGTWLRVSTSGDVVFQSPSGSMSGGDYFRGSFIATN